MAPICIDVGTTPRVPLRPTEKLELYEAQGGICPLCTRRMERGETLVDEHLRALGLGGTNDFDNRAMVHKPCAEGKTAGPSGDASRIAWAKRVKRKSLGFTASKRPLPGGRHDRLKRGLDGTVRVRATGALAGRAAR